VGAARQFHNKRGALADFALHPDAPTMMFNDLLADRQTQSGAFRFAGMGSLT
jgi:hypothetical protein